MLFEKVVCRDAEPEPHIFLADPELHIFGGAGASYFRRISSNLLLFQSPKKERKNTLNQCCNPDPFSMNNVMANKNYI
jgi:hypothetical protein